MTRIAFLLTNRYQMFHYAPVARALGESCTFVLERRDKDFDVTAEYVDAHVPGAPIDHIDKSDLKELDGRYQLVVCQTPPLPHALLDETLVVAQQYSLGKERYQYGAWRTLPDLNLMYGPYSVSQVQGFANAVATGNAMFDVHFDQGQPCSPATGTALYLPTYGSLSSLPIVAPALAQLQCEVIVKFHHMDEAANSVALPENCTVVRSNVSPVDLLAAADFVISDFSGAAYDALYAGRPLVLAGAPNPEPTDRARLSQADLDRSAIRALAAEWQPDMPLTDAVEIARDRIADDAAQHHFVERFYVNHGTAAKAAATAILDLLDQPATGHFGRNQVADNYREQLVKVRRLRGELRTRSAALKEARADLKRTRGELEATRRELEAVRTPLRWAVARSARGLARGARRAKRTISAFRSDPTVDRAPE